MHCPYLGMAREGSRPKWLSFMLWDHLAGPSFTFGVASTKDNKCLKPLVYISGSTEASPLLSGLFSADRKSGSIDLCSTVKSIRGRNLSCSRNGPHQVETWGYNCRKWTLYGIASSNRVLLRQSANWLKRWMHQNTFKGQKLLSNQVKIYVAFFCWS